MPYEFVDESAPAAGRYVFEDDKAKPAASSAPDWLSKAARVLPYGTGLLDIATGGKSTAGALRGVRDIIDTGAEQLSKLGGADEAAKVKAGNAAELARWEAENDGSVMGSGARLGAQALVTAPVGGMIAAPLKAAAPLLGRAAPLIGRVADSIGSSGMTTGMARNTIGQKAADLGVRALGGGVTGAATAAAVSPDDALSGGMIGAALPPAIQVASKVGNVAAQGVRSVLRPQIAKDAETVLRAGEFGAQDIPAIRTALGSSPRIGGGSNTPGFQGPQVVQAPLTVPQILQNPGISQFARTLDNAGSTALQAADATQKAARLAALNQVAPVRQTVQRAADDFGAVAQPGIVAADKAARLRTSRAFEGVDPFNEARIELPYDEFGAIAKQYVNPEIFGATPAQTVATRAEKIGTETFAPVAAAKAGPVGRTLAQEVRALGGIDSFSKSAEGLAGELRDLRQSKGMSGIVRNGSGKSPDKLAQELHARGLLPDDDPATLLNHLRDPELSGTAAHAVDQERAMAALRESSMGDAPGALTVPKPVPFRDAQDLRSFIAEQARTAGKAGEASTAAALNAQRAALDARVADAAAGNVRPGEYFPPDMQAAWKRARDLKKEQVDTFRTGPQAGLFRTGADELPAVNGGELASKFFNPTRAQTADIAGFNKVATPETRGLLQSYATTDLAKSADNKFGDLLAGKTGDWLDARSGSLAGLFDRGQNAQLGEIRKNLITADRAAELGLAKRSDTAKNLLSLGALESPVVNVLANRVPVIGRFTGPMLEALRASAKQGQVNRLGGLLADPAALERALAAAQASRRVNPLALGANGQRLLSAGVRAAPLLSTGQ